jgi:hypothetical protein
MEDNGSISINFENCQRTSPDTAFADFFRPYLVSYLAVRDRRGMRHTEVLHWEERFQSALMIPSRIRSSLCVCSPGLIWSKASQLFACLQRERFLCWRI